VSDNRTFATWHALVDKRLQALGTQVLSLVSDRAKALIQLAEKGLECLSMPDFFHCVHAIVKAMHSPWGGVWAKPTRTSPKPRQAWSAAWASAKRRDHGRGRSAARRGTAMAEAQRTYRSTSKHSRSRYIRSTSPPRGADVGTGRQPITRRR